MLMLDRYLVAGGRALDLATGASIRWRVRSGRASPPPLFTVRGPSWLIDFDRRHASRIEVWERIAGVQHDDTVETVDAFRAALADARDGRPRALDLMEASAERWTYTQRLLAREARLCGFVPLAADAFGAVLSQARWRWPSWLKDRAIVIFATDTRLSPDASLALFKLATKDARPHLVVRGITSKLWRPRLVSTHIHVHESAPMENLESPESLIARADALIEGGKFVDAEAAARWSILLSEAGDQSPSRCALARSLIGQRRLLEARATLAPIDNSEAAALRDRINQDVAEPKTEPAMVESFLEILRTCQEHEDPSTALQRVAMRLNHSLGATSVAFVIADRNRPHALAHAGTFAPSASQLEIALRVLDTGIAVPSSARGRSEESAWPIRYGATVVGALWCHWSMGVALIAQDVASILGLAATAAAPAMHEARERLRSPDVAAAMIPDLIGNSAPMEMVRRAVMKAAASPFPVLIEGESGAGKELVARAVHAASIRRGRRFSALNCAAIADELVEAELFGHTRGAFTGAVAERVGLFEECHGGTLFLDEVAELSARVQAKLLRTLQEGEVRRVGESGTRKVDARIVAATNRPLNGEVSAGRFRNDLRYRLDVLRIVIPPLRERLEDIPPLVRHIWSVLAKRTGSRAVLSPSAMSTLGSYDWPGNVRELQNVLASAMVAGPQRGVIGAQGLPSHITRTTAMTSRATLADARREFEERYVRAALARSGGRATVAARELGVSRQGLRKLTSRLGLDAIAKTTAALE
ncbi:MAG TPA: sigma 54-interacting transcriptional regulator [Vicinamibacterales bacterium]|nr:sigma 54-interacting transcriptional regulator [Vicinamibacterales bacterium]